MIKTMGDTVPRRQPAQPLAVLVAFTVLLALIGTTLACLNAGVRITYSMAKDKEMPACSACSTAGSPRRTAASRSSRSFGGLGVFGADPYQVDNLTQITLASNTGTFLVYGDVRIALVAFASRHDRHVVKHFVHPRRSACS